MRFFFLSEKKRHGELEGAKVALRSRGTSIVFYILYFILCLTYKLNFYKTDYSFI